MWDLTVPGNNDHDFYVIPGATSVLVHNDSCPLWTKTNYNGQTVYTRDDLMNPDYVSPADPYGRTNLKRMQQGLAPMGPDDLPVNLHHMLQTQDGPIAEITQSLHLGQGSYGVLHMNGNDIPSGIDRDAFAAWKTSYWKSRAAGM
jgi:hypothetical protein